jgi:hypothetical protein
MRKATLNETVAACVSCSGPDPCGPAVRFFKVADPARHHVSTHTGDHHALDRPGAGRPPEHSPTSGATTIPSADPRKTGTQNETGCKKNQGGHKTGAHKKSCRIAAAKAAAPE